LRGPAHYETLEAMRNLALFYDAAGRREESLKIKEQVLALDRKALGSQHPATLQAMNDLAWIQATSEAAEIRNGTNAVLLAEEAVVATHRKNPGFLDTLAASYAEARQFDKAAAAQLEAIGLAKSDEEKKDYESRLKLYQAKNPYRVKANP
jgi:tetratricopeptide (TPR) repeat protein